jgi:hypothetical protein
MKKQTGIWIDSSKAVIITFAEGREFIMELKSDIENRVFHHHEGNSGDFMVTRHINNEKKFDERKKQQTAHFLKMVIDEIKVIDELYVFGPAEMKTKLKKEIDGGDIMLRNKLKSVETADNMTTKQMVAKAKKYYNL